jgi:hypothetical protein
MVVTCKFAALTRGGYRRLTQTIAGALLHTSGTERGGVVAELTEVYMKIQTAVGIGLRRLAPKSDNCGGRRATSGAFSEAA